MRSCVLGPHPCRALEELHSREFWGVAAFFCLFVSLDFEHTWLHLPTSRIVLSYYKGVNAAWMAAVHARYAADPRDTTACSMWTNSPVVRAALDAFVQTACAGTPFTSRPNTLSVAVSLHALSDGRATVHVGKAAASAARRLFTGRAAGSVYQALRPGFGERIRGSEPGGIPIPLERKMVSEGHERAPFPCSWINAQDAAGHPPLACCHALIALDAEKNGSACVSKLTGENTCGDRLTISCAGSVL